MQIENQHSRRYAPKHICRYSREPRQFPHDARGVEASTSITKHRNQMKNESAKAEAGKEWHLDTLHYLKHLSIESVLEDRQLIHI